MSSCELSFWNGIIGLNRSSKNSLVPQTHSAISADFAETIIARSEGAWLVLEFYVTL
jgi:hypothetical protein